MHEDRNAYLDDPYLMKMLDDAAVRGSLTRDEQEALVLAAQAGDQEAMDRLILHNMRFCFKIALRHRNLGVEILDLFSAAIIGFRVGVMKHDINHARGANLLTSAAWWVRAQIQDEISERGHTIALSHHQLWNYRKIKNYLKECDTGRYHPTYEEISENTGVRLSTVKSLINVGEEQVSLNTRPIFGSTELSDRKELQDTLEARPMPDFMPDQSEGEWLNGLIDECLDEREALAIRGYFFDNRSLIDLSREPILGVTRERVRQLKNKALAKLASAIAEHDEQIGLTRSDRIEMLGTFEEALRDGDDTEEVPEQA